MTSVLDFLRQLLEPDDGAADREREEELEDEEDEEEEEEW